MDLTIYSIGRKIIGYSIVYRIIGYYRINYNIVSITSLEMMVVWYPATVAGHMPGLLSTRHTLGHWAQGIYQVFGIGYILGHFGLGGDGNHLQMIHSRLHNKK